VPPDVLLDTGPLVAYFNPRDEHHLWSVETFKQIHFPLLTCEPVLSEAFYLLSGSPAGQDRLADFCALDVLQINFRLLDNLAEVRALLNKYRNLPMDLADACLVHLADKHRGAALITTDRDFLIYRTRSRRQIPLIAPFISTE
jgi:uncharacterized protein